MVRTPNATPKPVTKKQLKAYLDTQADFYESRDFIVKDPIAIPKQFTAKKDIEISAFLAATIAWGNRTSIVKNARRMMELMHNQPHEFVINAGDSDLKPLQQFVHRTFNGDDFITFIHGLRHIYNNYGGLEGTLGSGTSDTRRRISNFKQKFFEIEHLPRTQKHISDPLKGSAAKRINMFLRWMVRSDQKGVDFGLWKNISPAHLMLPLDVHTGNQARALKLLKRKQNDWKAVEEVTGNLKKLNPHDPVKYDFALFGLGVAGDSRKLESGV